MSCHALRSPVKLLLVAGVLLVSSFVAVPASAVSSSDQGGSCAIQTPSADLEGWVDRSAAHARVWRLYQAFFLRQPLEPGLNYWLGRYRGGATLSSMASQFAEGEEFRNRYGSLDNDGFVRLVYRNVLCRTPQAAGLSYWTGQLDSGKLTRWDMVLSFSELREYLGRTGTCFSVLEGESSAAGHCDVARSPLSSATMSADGYQRFASGSIRGVEIDLSRNLLGTSKTRCSVASINANWLVAAEKDRRSPGVLGVGVVNGVPVKNSRDRGDRGVVGMRFDSDPRHVSEVWPGDTLSPDDNKLNSVMYADGVMAIESWKAFAEHSIYLEKLEPKQRVAEREWLWAVAGIPLIIDGQLDQDFGNDVRSDPYTYLTSAHPFLAVDSRRGRAVVGATASMTVPQIVQWAQASGYSDLIKFDGGGSIEYNEGGSRVVAGTGRDIPLWLGVGC